MMRLSRQTNPLIWLLLLLTAWACLGAPDWGQKTASGQNSWLESASGEMTGREAAPRLGFGGLAEEWTSGALVAANEAGALAKEAKIFSKEKQALVDMAKADKRTGVTSKDMEAYKDLNKSLPDPFPANKVRGPESHNSGAPSSREPHGHVGPVDHIPVKD